MVGQDRAESRLSPWGECGKGAHSACERRPGATPVAHLLTIFVARVATRKKPRCIMSSADGAAATFAAMLYPVLTAKAA